MFRRRLSATLIWSAVALLLVSVMPHNQSLWIDESTTALYARTATISEFSVRLWNDSVSDAQYPLGNFSYWLGSRALGTSEYGLRTISALWIALAVILMARIGYVLRLPFLPALLACHAFTWYYGGEVRPYAIQIAFGTGLLLAIVSVLKSPPDTRTGFFSFVIFGSALCTACMLGVIPTAVVGAAILMVLLRRGWSPGLAEKIAMVVTALYLVALGAYYAWTLHLGKGSQMIGVWNIGIKNVVFAGYELLGFTGFGPGRYELRELGLAGGVSGTVTGIVRPSMLGSVVLLGVYALAVRNLWTKHRHRSCLEIRFAGPIAAIAAFSSSIVFVLGMIVNYPFWGRHLAPIFPFIVFLMGIAVAECQNDIRSHRLLPAALCVTLLLSGLIVRFDPEHSRDDYRAAAHIARQSLRSGQIVWWSASAGPAVYYGLPLCEPRESPNEECPFCAIYLENESPNVLAVQPIPDVVIMTKEDLFDSQGALRDYVDAEGFMEDARFKAFSVLRRSHQTNSSQVPRASARDMEKVARVSCGSFPN